MSTAIGQYATLLPAKERLTTGGQAFGNTDDSLLQSFCNQVNGWIESKTGRVLAPYPAIATTVTAGGAAGSVAITLASAAGVNLRDNLMLGPVTGTHEHITVAAIAGNVVTLQSPLVTTYANGTAVSRVIILDGYDALEGGRMMPLSDGIVTATSLEVAFYTRGDYGLIPTTDWYLRPTPMSGAEPGWPATELWMTNFPTSGAVSTTFPSGFANVRLACTPGWPAIPDEISSLALNLVTTLYRRRGVGGGGDSMTTGSDGSRTISLLLDANDWRTIQRYTDKSIGIV